MIIHFVEVWFLFAVVFAIGCGLGALLHVALASGPTAVVQDNFAAAIGDRLDHLKWRLGLAPDWRPEARRTYVWPDLQQQPRLPAPVAAVEQPEEEWSEDEPSADESWDDASGWAEEGEEPPASDVVEAASAAFEDTDRDGTESGESELMRRPAALAEPRAGVPDNLQRIWGIGKRNEALLNNLGIYHFGQIASWTPAEARWVAAQLTFPERLERDNWIGQAIVLATGGDPNAVSSPNRDETPKAEEG